MTERRADRGRDIIDRIRRSREQNSESRRACFSMAAAGFLAILVADALPIANLLLQEEVGLSLFSTGVAHLEPLSLSGLAALGLGVVGLLRETGDRCYNRVPRPGRPRCCAPCRSHSQHDLGPERAERPIR